MYERPDVPKDNPNRNKIAVVVIMLVAVGLFVLGSTLWRLANVHSALGSGEVERALAAATVSDEAAQQLADAAGATRTGDDVECVLFAIVASKDSSELSGLCVASIDGTQGTARLIRLRTDALVAAGDASSSLGQLYADKGLAGLASALASASSVPMDHAVIMTQEGWDTFLEVAAQGSSALKRSATKLMDGIVKSDLDAAGLLDVAQRALSMGVSADDITDAGVADDQTLDVVGLARLVGVLA